jgi:hypothetical protein
MQVTYSGVGAPLSNDTWTNFGLTFNGTCQSSYLTSYGSKGLLGSATLCQLHLCQLSAPQDKLSAAPKVFSTELIVSEWKNISVSFNAQTCYPCRRVDATASLWGESYDAVQLAQQEEVLLQKLCCV